MSRLGLCAFLYSSGALPKELTDTHALGNRDEAKDLEILAMDHQQRLVSSNSRNFSLLLLFLIGALKKNRLAAFDGYYSVSSLVSIISLRNDYRNWSVEAYNALFIVRVFVKHFMETMNSDQIHEIFERTRVVGILAILMLMNEYS